MFLNTSKDSLIISRSLISSLMLSLFGVRNILELHHPPKGLVVIFSMFIEHLN